VKVLTLCPTRPERVVLFAPGAGGDPERHLPLLEYLAVGGCEVVAPYFERLSGPEANQDELLARPNGLIEALQERSSSDVPVVAVGHSIGGWAILCLAGGKPVGRNGHRIDVPREPRLSRLVLMAPAADWFTAPGALSDVSAPMLVYAAELDTVTPAEEVELLKNAPVPVDLRVIPKAGHFSFMHALPPGVVENSEFDRDAALARIADETLQFLNG